MKLIVPSTQKVLKNHTLLVPCKNTCIHASYPLNLHAVFYTISL